MLLYLIPIDWVAADRPFYSGKHKKHGMNLQVIANPGGDILGLRDAARLRARQESHVDLGRLGRAGGRWPGHPGRQGLYGGRARQDPVAREEQVRIPERG